MSLKAGVMGDAPAGRRSRFGGTAVHPNAPRRWAVPPVRLPVLVDVETYAAFRQQIDRVPIHSPPEKRMLAAEALDLRVGIKSIAGLVECLLGVLEMAHDREPDPRGS
jgi:hypothetical protein